MYLHCEFCMKYRRLGESNWITWGIQLDYNFKNRWLGGVFMVMDSMWITIIHYCILSESNGF